MSFHGFKPRARSCVSFTIIADTPFILNWN
jgi:hypothetical protein